MTSTMLTWIIAFNVAIKHMFSLKKMFVLFSKKIYRCLCAPYRLQLNRKLIIAIILGCVFFYLFKNIELPRRTENYFETAVESDIQKIKKVGILIACSYHENKEPLSLIISKLSTLCLPSILQTTETRFEYQIYIDVDLEIGSEFKTMNKIGILNLSLLLMPKAFYVDTINMLAIHAYNNGFDYFATIPFDAQLRWKYWTSRAIMSLMGHCPSDVGVALQQCDENNKLSIVSRSHIERFGYVYPSRLPLNQLTEWITSIYLPNYVSTLSINQENECQTNKSNPSSAMTRHSHSQQERRGSACVVSYSLYGSDKRYTDGAIENAYLMKTIYPGWTMWVYHDSSVPSNLINMICKQTHIKCVDMTGSRLTNKMVWRFLVTNSHQIARYIVRDIDSRLSMREKIAVNEWILSGKRFHVMRDHPSHKFEINGGMWGGTGRSLSDLYVKLFKQNPKSTYIADMTFLCRVAWPMMKTSVIQHDSYYCEKYRGKPFPTPRIGWEHVGSVFINNMVRDVDINMLKKYKQPNACQSGISLFEIISF